MAKVVADLPEAEAVLLTASFADDEVEPGTRADELIEAAVIGDLSRSAARRKLERFDPDFRWYEGR